MSMHLKIYHNKDEKESLKLNNLISQEELKNLQTEDEEGELVDNFKEEILMCFFYSCFKRNGFSRRTM
jgi:hypothetical protein